LSLTSRQAFPCCTLAAHSHVLANAATSYFTQLLCTCWSTQRPLLPQSLHCSLNCWCSQMLLPPQSLHVLLRRWCSQIPLLPQSLHWLVTRWCLQRPLPLQSLHLLLCRCCLQIVLPSQSLHVLLCLWCLQRPLLLQSLHMLSSVAGARRSCCCRSLCTVAPPPLVLAEAVAWLLGCTRMRYQSHTQTRHTGWVHATLFVFAALLLWPSGSVSFYYSLLTCSHCTATREFLRASTCVVYRLDPCRLCARQTFSA